MRNWPFILILAISSALFAKPIKDHTVDTKALTDLLIALDIPSDSDVVTETQKRWLRKPGLERWEMREIPLDQKEFVLQWAKEQGLFSAWIPSEKEYDKALILGSNTSGMQVRLNYLIDLWNEGIRFHEIVWLTGDRPLDERVDGLTNRCFNESEAARLIWDAAAIPEQMKQLPVVFVCVPMLQQGDTFKRPTTQDTIIAWLNKEPGKCKVLFVSDQPFCGYQFAILKSMMPDTIDFDVVGAAADPSSHASAAAITLDSLARWLYQETVCR